ncbi:MAG TPA: NAD-binding protein [Gaiellaceae bacterium]|nr:NAD-binding protein [Gaiellaceae bacterium]
MERSPVTLRQVLVAATSFAALCVVGTIGFALISDESAFDAFYRTIITVYTAGLVSAPTSTSAKVFTIVLVVWGVAIFLYVFGLIIELTVSGTVSGAWEARRLAKRVEQLQEHVIVCGYGRVGRRAVLEFREVGVPYVVLDHGADAVAYARSHGDLYIEGRGTQDEDLENAGIRQARGLIACSDSDVDNLYITLSARALRDDLFIVARASTADARTKLELGGADRIVQPYATAGLHMANLVLKPQVADFLDIVSTAGGPMPDLRFEEIVVDPTCIPCGRSIGELRIREKTGALVIALRKADGTFDPTPDAAAVLEAGDVLIGVGTTDEMEKLEALFAPSEVRVA